MTLQGAATSPQGRLELATPLSISNGLRISVRDFLRLRRSGGRVAAGTLFQRAFRSTRSLAKNKCSPIRPSGMSFFDHEGDTLTV
jgi:hypothetical protein